MPDTTGSADPADPADPLRVAARPELIGDRRVGVLLSHGFTGTPASVRPWAEHLAELGYGVAVPRLPGHGTTWQDLNRCRWEDWYGEVARAFDQLCLDHDAVVLAGLSMGGALVLRLAQEHPDRVAGVALVNPAIASRRLDLKLVPLLKWVVPSLPGIADDISAEGVTEGGYDRTPLKALHSFVRHWPGLVADLPKVVAPVLVMRSTEDHVVDDLSLDLLRERLGSDDVTEVALSNSFHVATLDHDAPLVFERTAGFVARITAT